MVEADSDFTLLRESLERAEYDALSAGEIKSVRLTKEQAVD
jgi:hypothetical protein